MTEYVIEFVLDDKTSVTKIMEFENAGDANAAILSEMSNPTPEFI